MMVSVLLSGIGVEGTGCGSGGVDQRPGRPRIDIYGQRDIGRGPGGDRSQIAGSRFRYR